MSGGGAHWSGVYATREEADLTWFENEPTLSLRLVTSVSEPSDPVLDVGAGASRLVDGLLEHGYTRLSCLDLTDTGLARSRARLGQAADRVTWIVADVTRWSPEPGTFAVWHDRAAFHFLTEAGDRQAYVERMARALRPGGHGILMTFAEDGPETCSGLPVRRWSTPALVEEIETRSGGAITGISGERHAHRTPAGRVQPFRATLLRRD